MTPSKRVVRGKSTRGSYNGVAARILTIVLVALLLDSSPALGHEPIDPDTAQEFLSRIAELNAIVGPDESVARNAEGLYALGETVGRLTEVVNGDLAMHGEAGLVSTVLLNELRALGIELAFFREANRYKTYLRPFERYVALAPEGAKHADALFRILQARFYDSFVYDPFSLVDLDWQGLVAQIEEAEALLSRYPDHRDKEEALFILAVDYVRASRKAPSSERARAYQIRARAALKAFHETYPDSLRAVAARTLMESLPPAD